MRSVEVKGIKIGSAFKSFLFACVIPSLIVLVVLLITFFVIGSFFTGSGQTENSGAVNATAGQTGNAAGQSATQVIVFLLPLLISPLCIGLVGLVFIVSYNLMASKFGGLIIKVSDHEK